MKLIRGAFFGIPSEEGVFLWDPGRGRGMVGTRGWGIRIICIVRIKLVNVLFLGDVPGS